MRKELGLLNVICIVLGIVFVGLAIWTALFSPQFFTTDNLFFISVCLVMALMFLASPLLYLQSEGRLPIPFTKRSTRPEVAQLAGSGPPLLDAKGRAVPPDVKSMMARMKQKRSEDV
ncbi:MAG: hypothetical protein H0U18_13640 [Pyrinomonadaceae bacterium]|jgi:hypothetical protein|nr:hypothetical protein [Pyrinomonadaceae bacterium]